MSMIVSSDQNSWQYIFAVKAPLGERSLERIYIFNADGSRYTESNLNKDDIDPIEGTLKFTKNDIPDGGYIAVVDRVGNQDNILILDKGSISDALIKINYPQGQQSCITKGALLADNNLKKVNIGYEGQHVTSTSVETYLGGKSPTQSSTLKNDINVLASNEYILVSGYDTNLNILEYAYVDKGSLINSSSPVNPNTVFLEGIQDTTTIDFMNTANAVFSALHLKSTYQNNTFDWFNWNTSNTSFTTRAPEKADYSYAAQYNGSLNGWDVQHTKTIDNGYVNINLSNLDPSPSSVSLDCSNSSCQLNLSDITSLDTTALKLTFTEGNANYTVHTQGDLVLPRIPNVSYPDQNTALTTSLLISETSNSELSTAFRVLGNTRDYQPANNFVDLLLVPADDLLHQKVMLSHDYTIITK